MRISINIIILLLFYSKYTVKPVISYRGNIGPIYACLILDKDTYISGGADGKIRIFKKPPPEDLGNFDNTFYFPYLYIYIYI